MDNIENRHCSQLVDNADVIAIFAARLASSSSSQ